MLRSLKQLYGDQLGATDGEIGRVKDFYFDDRNWVVRYVVADTGSWLPERKVLISPHAFGSLPSAGKVLHVNLTRKKIEDSPSIDTRKPVSRQYEEEYHRYYGWPSYWEGDGLWGLYGVPILELPTNSPAEERVPVIGPQREPAEAHLWSALAVNGYQIQAGDGTAGHICDFLMDEQSWAISRLVVKTGHRLSGKDVQIATSNVERISHEASTVFLNMTRAAVEHSSAHPLDPRGLVL